MSVDINKNERFPSSNLEQGKDDQLIFLAQNLLSLALLSIYPPYALMSLCHLFLQFKSADFTI
jgi:hypothetical protein